MTATPFPPGSTAGTQDRRELRLNRLSFADLADFGQDDHLEAFQVFARSCAAILDRTPPLRDGVAASAALKAIAYQALRALRQEVREPAQARRFFERHFRPYRVSAGAGVRNAGFLTGYYEPVVEGSLAPTRNFTAPVRGRPDNLNALAPYPDRAAIEAGAIERRSEAIVWLRDRVEVFLAQVQGSARVRRADGSLLRLGYAGRNGHPYTSIGRILIDTGEIAEADMSLAQRGMRAGCRPDRRPRDKLDGITVDRRRPRDLDLRIALLDCRRSALARFVPFPLPAPYDRPGHRFRHHRSRPRRYFLRLGG
jgi:membrane-bound lytic murein transglycosylase